MFLHRLVINFILQTKWRRHSFHFERFLAFPGAFSRFCCMYFLKVEADLFAETLSVRTAGLETSHWRERGKKNKINRSVFEHSWQICHLFLSPNDKWVIQRALKSSNHIVQQMLWYYYSVTPHRFPIVISFPWGNLWPALRSITLWLH